MRIKSAMTCFVAISCGTMAQPLWALNRSVFGIGGDVSRLLLGDGTGVVVGVMDSGIDDLHPALTGLDSLGNPRLVAERNFVLSELGNAGDDIFGHGTWVTSAIASRDAVYTGMAPDVRYVNARVLDAGNGFAGQTQVQNGIGFAIDRGADVLNLSLNFFAPNSGGDSQLDLMLDWAAYDRGVSSAICVGNISQSSGSTTVRGPGSAYNGMTVGRTDFDFDRVDFDSATAFTADGRMKPDVVAPGTGLTLASDDWEGAGQDWNFGLSGCSFATPHVAGMMAQQIEAGRREGFSVSPLVIKATMMNSASKVLDKLGNSWAPFASNQVGGVYSTTAPLDDQSGTGQINGPSLAAQYLAGESSPGLVEAIGWDLADIGNGQVNDYLIDPKQLVGMTATLVWARHVGRTDDGDGIIDSGDQFFTTQSVSNLSLQLLRDGSLVAQSMSSVGNVEHLTLSGLEEGQYTLRVAATALGGRAREPYALAWYGTTVPEPSAFVLMGLGAAAFAVVLRWRG